MQQATRARWTIFSLACAALVAASMAACGGSIAPTPLTPTQFRITALPSDAEMLSEKTLGSASAPNSVAEYLSFATTTSRDYYLTGDGASLKTQLADTGKAQIVLRNLFVGGETPSAAMLARCGGNAEFFNATNTIFTTQSSWAGSTDPEAALQRVMLGFGMSQSVINACLADNTLLNGIAQIAGNALQATYQLPDGSQRTPISTAAGPISILAVPAVVVNGVLLLDGRNADGSLNADNAPTLANVQKFLK